MFFLIIIAIILAWSMPWVFRYFVMVPFIGTGLGVFTWALCGLLTDYELFTPRALACFVVGGLLTVAYAIKKSDL